MKTSHNSVAKSVRERKEKYPEKYCKEYNCLWRTDTRQGFKPCPKHSHDAQLAANTKAWAEL